MFELMLDEYYIINTGKTQRIRRNLPYYLIYADGRKKVIGKDFTRSDLLHNCININQTNNDWTKWTLYPYMLGLGISGNPVVLLDNEFGLIDIMNKYAAIWYGGEACFLDLRYDNVYNLISVNPITIGINTYPTKVMKCGERCTWGEFLRRADCV